MFAQTSELHQRCKWCFEKLKIKPIIHEAKKKIKDKLIKKL